MPKHLALPIRVAANGGLLALEQDGESEIAQSVALLLSTQPGERRSVPDYGLPDPVFGGLDQDDVTDVVSTWEERADPAFVEQLADDLVNQRVTVFPTPQLDVDEEVE